MNAARSLRRTPVARAASEGSSGPDEALLASAFAPRALARGRAYFLGGALFDARRGAHGVRARCEGSSDGPYTVRAGFGANDGFVAECSCPVGAEGRCKHAAALLLAWHHAPDEFLAVPDVDAALATLSGDALRALLRALRRRHPELDASLEELLLPAASVARASAASCAGPRRAVAQAFRRHGGAPEQVAALADDLAALSRAADARAAQGAVREAAEVYRALAYGVVLRAGRCHDELGLVRAVGDAALDKLAACSSALDEPARDDAREALVALAVLEAEHDGPPLGARAMEALRQHGDEADLRLVGAALEARVSALRAREPAGFALRCYDALRVALGPRGEASLEAYLARCASFGVRRAREAALAHLELEAPPEATQRALAALDDEGLCWVALRSRGDERAAKLLAARVSEGAGRPSPRVLAALHAWSSSQGRADEALRWRALGVALRPEPEAFAQLRDDARALGAWERVRAEVLAQVAQRAGTQAVALWLGEGCFDEALRAARTGRFEGGYGARALARAAALAAEKARLDDAYALELRAAETYVDARGRANYREAARAASRARALAEQPRAGEGDEASAARERLDAWRRWALQVGRSAEEGPRRSAALVEEWAGLLAAHGGAVVRRDVGGPAAEQHEP